MTTNKRYTWQDGEIITVERLNEIENIIAQAIGGGGGSSAAPQKISIYHEDLNNDPPDAISLLTEEEKQLIISKLNSGWIAVASVYFNDQNGVPWRFDNLPLHCDLRHDITPEIKDLYTLSGVKTEFNVNSSTINSQEQLVGIIARIEDPSEMVAVLFNAERSGQYGVADESGQYGVDDEQTTESLEVHASTFQIDLIEANYSWENVPEK